MNDVFWGIGFLLWLGLFVWLLVVSSKLNDIEDEIKKLNAYFAIWRNKKP